MYLNAAMAAAAELLQLCPTLCDPIDGMVKCMLVLKPNGDGNTAHLKLQNQDLFKRKSQATISTI